MVDTSNIWQSFTNLGGKNKGIELSAPPLIETKRRGKKWRWRADYLCCCIKCNVLLPPFFFSFITIFFSSFLRYEPEVPITVQGKGEGGGGGGGGEGGTAMGMGDTRHVYCFSHVNVTEVSDIGHGVIRQRNREKGNCFQCRDSWGFLMMKVGDIEYRVVCQRHRQLKHGCFRSQDSLRIVRILVEWAQVTHLSFFFFFRIMFERVEGKEGLKDSQWFLRVIGRIFNIHLRSDIPLFQLWKGGSAGWEGFLRDFCYNAGHCLRFSRILPLLRRRSRLLRVRRDYR